MPSAEFSHEPVSFGHQIFKGDRNAPLPHKLAVLYTSQHRGLTLNGVGLSSPLHKSDWMIRLTSPIMHLDELRRLLEYAAAIPEDSLPAEMLTVPMQPAPAAQPLVPAAGG